MHMERKYIVKKKTQFCSYFYSLGLNNILCLHKGQCLHLFVTYSLLFLNSKFYNCLVVRQGILSWNVFKTAKYCNIKFLTLRCYMNICNIFRHLL